MLKDVFTLYAEKNKQTSEPKYNYTLCYSIGLHIKDLSVLKEIRAYLKGIGNLTTRLNVATYRITSLSELKLVIDHFDKYPLITQKYADYIFFF
jgi:hypothetical protein